MPFRLLCSSVPAPACPAPLSLPAWSSLSPASLAGHGRAAGLALARPKFPCLGRSLSCSSADNKGCFSMAWCRVPRLQAARGPCCSSFSLFFFLFFFSLPRSSRVKAVALWGTRGVGTHLYYWRGCFSESNVPQVSRTPPCFGFLPKIRIICSGSGAFNVGSPLRGDWSGCWGADLTAAVTWLGTEKPGLRRGCACSHSLAGARGDWERLFNSSSCS